MVLLKINFFFEFDDLNFILSNLLLKILINGAFLLEDLNEVTKGINEREIVRINFF